MRTIIFVVTIATLLLTPFSIVAQKKSAVVHLCFKMDEKPFLVATQDKTIAHKRGLVAYKDGMTYMMKMRVFVDGVPHPYVKPFNENCVSLFRIPTGKHTITASFRAVSYTPLSILTGYTKKFRPKLLYETTLEVIKTSTTHLTIKQISNRIQVHESITNNPIPNCATGCDIPIAIPIYFKERSGSQQIPCPADYTLTVKSEKERTLPCYAEESIREVLSAHIKEHKITCKPYMEKAHFKLFGEGCLILFESNRDGLDYQPPEKQLIPLAERKYHYFLSTDGTKKKYKLNKEKSGENIIPGIDKKLIFTEEKTK